LRAIEQQDRFAMRLAIQSILKFFGVVPKNFACRQAGCPAVSAGLEPLTGIQYSVLMVRDIYPIARSSTESFINAAFLLVEDEAAAERAVRWVKYRAWKEVNRTVGSGQFSLRSSTMQADENPPVEFAEFTAKGASREWFTLDTPSRIRRVGELAGKKAGSRLLGAYSLIYSVSSEIIHGSPFGVNFFHQAHMPQNPTVEDFREATGKQVEDILVDVAHAAAGYLAAFFQSQKMPAPYVAEQEIFNRLLALEGVESQKIDHMS
jgi:hypothetical protein